MSNPTAQCIRKYIKEKYIGGGLIGISDLANFCQKPEGVIFVALTELEDENEVRIITRYFCPDTHYIPKDSVPYCPTCGLKYPKAFIHALVFAEPLKIAKKKV
jgi:hypothetical protein